MCSSHSRFLLNTDQVKLIINVTIIQDVAPAMSFCNPGDAIFQSLPCNNTLDLLPLICTNSSCGGVTIDPVILDPWVIHFSDVEATITELPPATTSYVTIGERFNMTIKACLPESWTGIYLNATLPHEGLNALVTLNNAYVTFIGSELLNTTLMEGDSEALSLEKYRELIWQNRQGVGGWLVEGSVYSKRAKIIYIAHNSDHFSV